MKETPRVVTLLILLAVTPGVVDGQEPVEPVASQQPASAPQPVGVDPLEQFVPKTPRSEVERERLDALRAYVAARALEDQRQWSEAIALLEQAKKLDPQAVAVLRRLARLYFGMGRVDDGIEASRQAIEADPNDPETFERLVRFYLQAGKVDEAQALLEKILADAELKKGSVTELVVLRDLAQIYLGKNQFDQAVEPLSRLVQALDAKEATRFTSGELELILGNDPAGTYRRFGEAFYNARRFDEAVKAFRRSMAYDPDDLQTPLLLAQSLLRSGKSEEALATLEPVLAKRPPGRIAYDVLGQILGGLGRRKELVSRLEAASQADPKNYLLKYALGEQYEEEGQVERARELYRRVISEQPDPQGVRALADSLRAAGKSRELVELFETAITQPQAREVIEPQIRLIATDPEEAGRLLDAGIELLRAEPPKLGPAGRLILVEIAKQAGLTDQLVALDRLNLERSPSPTSYTELITTLTSAGRHAEAVEVINEMLGKFPELSEEPRLISALGEAQFNAGQVEAALQTGQKLLAKDPNDFVAIQLVGFALSRLGRNEEAIALYQGVLQRMAENQEATKLARIWLSSVYSNLGDMDRAEAELQLLLEKDPDDAWVNNDLGYLWADRGKNLEQAETMIRKAVAQEPENGSYRDSLGWILFKLGRVEDAIRELEEAARLKKGDATILDHLGDAFFRQGRVEDARKAWEEAEKLAKSSNPPDKALQQILEKLEALRSQGLPTQTVGGNP